MASTSTPAKEAGPPVSDRLRRVPAIQRLLGRPATGALIKAEGGGRPGRAPGGK